MGNRNSSKLNRGCFEFSIRTASVKKPALYVEAPQIYDADKPHLIETALHGQLSQKDLDDVWADVDVDEKGYLEGPECLTLIRDIVQELPHLTQVQLTTAQEAIDRIYDIQQARKRAERKASLTMTPVERKEWDDVLGTLSADREKSKQSVAERSRAILQRLETTNASKDLQVMADDLAASLKDSNGRITKDSFDRQFQTNLRTVLQKHGVDCGISTSELLPARNSPSFTALSDDTRADADVPPLTLNEATPQPQPIAVAAS